MRRVNLSDDVRKEIAAQSKWFGRVRHYANRAGPEQAKWAGERSKLIAWAWGLIAKHRGELALKSEELAKTAMSEVSETLKRLTTQVDLAKKQYAEAEANRVSQSDAQSIVRDAVAQIPAMLPPAKRRRA